jgi:hypothetical protein
LVPIQTADSRPVVLCPGISRLEGSALKKLVRSLMLATALAAMVAVPALAAEGGAPAKHGVDGKTFGYLVSQLAQSYPGAVADHVSGR